LLGASVTTDTTIDRQTIKRKKQTILTSEKHTEYTTKGQQVSRHSSQPDVFYFFSSPHFLKTILASRTSGTFGFAPTHKANPSAKPKEPLFSQRTAKNDVSYPKNQVYPDN
jgi:hypothetical protein